MVWYTVDACVIDLLLQGMPNEGNLHAVAVRECGIVQAENRRWARLCGTAEKPSVRGFHMQV